MGTVHQAWKHGVTRVAPTVCREVTTRDLKDPCRFTPGLQVGSRLVPVAGHILRTLDQPSEHLALPEGRKIGHDQYAKPDCHRLLPAGPPPP